MNEIRDHLLNQKKYEINYILSKKYIEREISPIIWDNNLIEIIVGPRRCGKSHYAIQMISQRGSFAYTNFDDIFLTKITNFDEFLLDLEYVYGKFNNVLFDEIQNLPNWENLIGILQRRGLKIIITGSNSKLTSSELATNLTGRYHTILLFPFSFQEYLNVRQITMKSHTKVEILNVFEQYITNGGYPEPMLFNINRYSYLKELFDAILYKDIELRYNIRKPKLMADFCYYLISNLTQELSYNKLAKRLGCASDLLQTYFEYLNKVFLFFEIPRFSERVSEQIIYNKKVYCIDTGFTEGQGFRILGNEDLLYQNIVAITLHKLELEGKIQVFYWRSAQNWEIDFIIKQQTKITHLIQVTFKLDNIKTDQREFRSLIVGSESLHCDNLILLNRDQEKIIDRTWQNITKTVHYIPLWKWLIDVISLY